MSKVIDTVSPEAIALATAINLHSTMLLDDAWYNGTKEGFDALYDELFVIARDFVPSNCENLSEKVEETFFQFQCEIERGERDVDWYLF